MGQGKLPEVDHYRGLEKFEDVHKFNCKFIFLGMN